MAALLVACVGLQAAPQSFAVALPELEGPVTMGIFAADGTRVRLLYRDADIGSIPAGLNGLIMTWDGKDDAGSEVPPGTYRARGLIHGPIRCTSVPWMSERSFYAELPPELPWQRPLIPHDTIVMKAPPDELLDGRPLLRISAAREGQGVALEAEGQPVWSAPLDLGFNTGDTVFLRHGDAKGSAQLVIRSPSGDVIHTITGLDRIVPLNAGTLEVSADASLPTVNSGESRP